MMAPGYGPVPRPPLPDQALKPDRADLRAEELAGRVLYILGIIALAALLVALVVGKLLF